MAFNRDSSLDISLGTGAGAGGASDGTTLWFVDNSIRATVARAYVAATRARDSAKDISLGTGFWQGGLSTALRSGSWMIRAIKRVLTWPLPERGYRQGYRAWREAGKAVF